MVVSSDKAAFAKHIWPSHYARVPQGRGNLGQRMRSLSLKVLNGAACTICGDISIVSKAHIQSVFKSLVFVSSN